MAHITTLESREDYAKIIYEPLERGYGQTIGNALRRVLLGSIQGAAISAIRIDKVFHEFAPIPGVKEDATELILNLKSVAFRYIGAEPLDEETVTISVQGPGKVTGADIVTPPTIEVANPEVYIATISDSKAWLNMELKLTWGSGYILPEKQERYKGIIGLIPFGSQYTPVIKTNYTVEQTRVGQRTDFERLILEIWTNGAIRPNDAISQAAHILDRNFRMFFDLGAAGFETPPDVEEDEVEDMRDIPDIKLEELEMSQRTYNSLRRAGLLSLRHLALAAESDLSAIRGFGKKSLLEVRDKLREHGLELKPPKGGVRMADFMDDDEEEEDF